jgi:hypothetical protein
MTNLTFGLNSGEGLSPFIHEMGWNGCLFYYGKSAMDSGIARKFKSERGVAL